MGENNALQASENTGIIPRFCKDLFNEVEQIHSENIESKVCDMFILKIEVDL